LNDEKKSLAKACPGGLLLNFIFNAGQGKIARQKNVDNFSLKAERFSWNN